MNATETYFPNPLSEFIFMRTYSRWVPEKRRRETWPEAVGRIADYYDEISEGRLSRGQQSEIHEALLNMQVMPSMRLAWTAGDAARKNSIGIYNCSYLPIDRLSAFAEVMYLLMHGTGVGFSCERHHVDQLPDVPKLMFNKATFQIQDSKEGWAQALVNTLVAMFTGYDVDWDFSRIRPAGAPLNTFGGRASGPEPLRDTLVFVRNLVHKRRGSRLSCIDVHDIVCKIAESIIVGGVRRSALISLSDLHDEEMRAAKTGAFWETHPHRSLSNNSAVYNRKPSATEFLPEWSSLVASGTGERGIFNRSAALACAPDRRDLSNEIHSLGSNPCCEIILPANSFCNLTSVVVRPNDQPADLMQKVQIATVLGTLQSTQTNFGFLHELNPAWKANAERERLLGVSLTGILDHPHLAHSPELLQRMRDCAISTNKETAATLGIVQSAAITTVKPEGTSSTCNSTSAGIHSRHAPYYLRRVRISSTDPLFRMMKDQGVSFVPENGQSEKDANTWVCAFPIAAPEGAKTRHDYTAIESLEIWKTVKQNWAEHSVSATISVAEDEWLDVGAWVHRNFNHITGLSFLPKSEHVYPLAPYEDITREQYEREAANFPTLDYTQLGAYETEDYSRGQQPELACVGNQCDIL